MASRTQEQLDAIERLVRVAMDRSNDPRVVGALAAACGHVAMASVDHLEELAEARYVARFDRLERERELQATADELGIELP